MCRVGLQGVQAGRRWVVQQRQRLRGLLGGAGRGRGRAPRGPPDGERDLHPARRPAHPARVGGGRPRRPHRRRPRQPDGAPRVAARPRLSRGVE